MEFSDRDLDFAVEAIDKISAHKNRPNLPRIARYLYRIHDFSSHKTIKILEHLLAENRVKEVVYKGNISYRNPLRWKWRRSNFGVDTNKLVMNSFVVKTLKVLHSSNTALAKTGVSDVQLERALLISNPSLTADEVKKLILTELEVEAIQRNQDGLLVISHIDGDQSSAQNSSEEMSDGGEIVNNDDSSGPRETLVVKKPVVPAPAPAKKEKETPQAVRKGDRIIRKRTRYDPSEYFCPPLVKRKKQSQEPLVKEEKRAPKKSAGRKKRVVKPVREGSAAPVRSGVQQTAPLLSSFHSPIIVMKDSKIIEEKVATANTVRNCFLCRNPTDTLQNKASPCVTCHRIAHDLCIKKDEEPRLGTLKWMCVMCRSLRHSLCVVCHTPDLKVGKRWSFTCDSCQSLYHNDCHHPPPPSPLGLGSKIWICSRCTNRDNLSNSLIGCGPEVGTQTGTSMFLASTPGTECLLSDPLAKSISSTIKVEDKEQLEIKSKPEAEGESKTDLKLNTDLKLETKIKEEQKPEIKLKAEMKPKEQKGDVKPKEQKVETKPKEQKVEAKQREQKAEVKPKEQRVEVKPVEEPKEEMKPNVDSKLELKPKMNPNVEVKAKVNLQSEVKQKADANPESSPKLELEPNPKLELKQDQKKLAGKQLELSPAAKLDNYNPCLYRADDIIPDVTKWTIEEVSSYFKNRLGDAVAEAFLHQEVDGAGLKVMSREDVTDRLGLKLGAALKTLYIVRKIQRSSCDLITLWAN